MQYVTMRRARQLKVLVCLLAPGLATDCVDALSITIFTVWAILKLNQPLATRGHGGGKHAIILNACITPRMRAHSKVRFRNRRGRPKKEHLSFRCFY